MPDTIKLKSKGVILAKTEVTYGVDPTPVAATNAIMVENPTIDPIIKKLVRNNVRSFMGKSLQLNIGEGLKITFKTELKGSGAAGTAPEIGPLLRACNFTEVLVALASATYNPNSLIDSAESVTIYFYLDGLLHIASGCRGTFSLDAKAGEYGEISWDFTGIYAGPTDSANPVPTLNATIPPRFVSGAFALDSYAAVIAALKISIGNAIGKRPSANAATGILQYIIKDRGVTGSIDPEVVSLATKSFWAMMASGAGVTFTGKFGATAGNICTITAPSVQLDDLKYGEREGILTYALPLNFVPTAAGNDEIQFAFT